MVTVIISDETEVKTKTIIKYKEGHYIMIKRSIQQKDMKFVNTYAASTGVPKYIKEILNNLSRERDTYIVIGNVNTH